MKVSTLTTFVAIMFLMVAFTSPASAQSAQDEPPPGWINEAELNVGAGYGADSNSDWIYFWALGCYYPFETSLEVGRYDRPDVHRFGGAVLYGGFNGDTEEPYDFHGGKLLAGLSYQWSQGFYKDQTTFRLLVGKRWDDGSSAEYYSRGRTSLVQAQVYHDHHRLGKKWWPKLNAHLVAEFDVSHEKSSSAVDWEDPPEDRNCFEVGFLADVYDYKYGKFRPRFGLQLAYYDENDSSDLVLIAGFSAWREKFMGDVRYTISHNDENAIGINVAIDLWKVVKAAW